MTVYIAAPRPAMHELVAPPGDHKYVYPETPPEGETQMAPVLAPQAVRVVVALSLIIGIIPTDTVFVVTQLFASFSVTV